MRENTHGAVLSGIEMGLFQHCVMYVYSFGERCYWRAAASMAMFLVIMTNDYVRFKG